MSITESFKKMVTSFFKKEVRVARLDSEIERFNKKILTRFRGLIEQVDRIESGEVNLASELSNIERSISKFVVLEKDIRGMGKKLTADLKKLRGGVITAKEKHNLEDCKNIKREVVEILELIEIIRTNHERLSVDREIVRLRSRLFYLESLFEALEQIIIDIDEMHGDSEMRRVA
ncbi:MAG: hypothetical protein WC595_04965 [Candidatus Nanoarchaeia archaeon]